MPETTRPASGTRPTSTLGGETVTIWLTPGHTAGTISYTFPVLDHGRRVNVVYSGGTALVFEPLQGVGLVGTLSQPVPACGAQ